MSTVFADTSYFIALVSPHDAVHRRAHEFGSRHRGRLIVTEYVLVEVANFLSRQRTRRLFNDLLSACRTSPGTSIVPASATLFEAACDLFRDRPDKDWSLTDCASFVTMNENGITEALTADRHFEQAGYLCLLV